MLVDLWERYRTIVIGLGIAVLGVCAWLFYPEDKEEAPSFPLQPYVHAMESEPAQAVSAAPADTVPSSAPKDTTKPEEKPAAKMYVDVKGRVQYPGLYEFAANDRVQHAIAMAGGFLPDADVSRVNLAQPLVDGMVLWIPEQGEPDPPPLLAANCPCQQTTAADVGSAEASSGAADGKVNLNHASLEQLMSLPGIGATRAQAIITYREQNGPFTSPEQIKNVSGIGEKVYSEIKDKISAP